MSGAGGAVGWYPDPWDQRRLRWWDGTAWTGHVHRATAPPPPPHRLIRTSRDAEIVAAEWMAFWGFTGAQCTPKGKDGGVDVESADAVAQVKAQHKPVSRPTLQALHGVAVARAKCALCFSLDSYTADATQWADEVGIALFRFDLQGIPEPVNDVAHRALHAHARDSSPLPSPPMGREHQSVSPPGRLVLGHTISSDRAATFADEALRKREQVLFRATAWLPLARIRVSYSVPSRRGPRSFTNDVLHETLIGARWFPKSTTVQPMKAAVDRAIIPPCVNVAELAAAGQQQWNHLATLSQTAAIERCRARLADRGVPPQATAAGFQAVEELLLPLHLCFVQGVDGGHVIVIDCHRGEPSPQLSWAATQRMSWLGSALAT